MHHHHRQSSLHSMECCPHLEYQKSSALTTARVSHQQNLNHLPNILDLNIAELHPDGCVRMGKRNAWWKHWRKSLEFPPSRIAHLPRSYRNSSGTTERRHTAPLVRHLPLYCLIGRCVCVCQKTLSLNNQSIWLTETLTKSPSWRKTLKLESSSNQMVYQLATLYWFAKMGSSPSRWCPTEQNLMKWSLRKGTWSLWLVWMDQWRGIFHDSNVSMTWWNNLADIPCLLNSHNPGYEEVPVPDPPPEQYHVIE